MRVPVEVLGGLLSQQSSQGSLPELPSAPYVLFAGDPSGHKGIDTLLSVWAGSPRPPATLLIAATRDVGRELPADVEVLRLDRSQMPEAWRRAAAAVVPSMWAEPFGMAAMEALAAGTPVVASAVGALPEIVRDGVDGLLVPPGDAEALRVALTVLLEDHELRARLSEDAVRGAGRFSRAVVLPRFEALYDRLRAGRVEACR
jgi:glycosyltransferase involved in cell wall biosynthesis